MCGFTSTEGLRILDTVQKSSGPTRNETERVRAAREPELTHPGVEGPDAVAEVRVGVGVADGERGVDRAVLARGHQNRPTPFFTRYWAPELGVLHTSSHTHRQHTHADARLVPGRPGDLLRGTLRATWLVKGAKKEV